jgi:hypothetical protein
MSLLAPPTKDGASFTGVLEELIGADPDAENEIDPHGETNSSENLPKNTPANRLEQLATESADIAETPMKSAFPQSKREVSAEAGETGVRHLVPKIAPAVPPSLEQEVSSELEPTAALPAKQEGDIGAGYLAPQFAANKDYRISIRPDGVRDSADLQNQRLVFECPSPDGRGWPEGPGEGYKMNLSPGTPGHALPSEEVLSPQEDHSDVRQLVSQLTSETNCTSDQPDVISQFVPNWGHQPGVTPDGAPDSADIRNQKSAFERPVEMFLRYPSPGPSGHPLPSGEGLPPRFKQAAPAESVDNDPTALICNLGPLTIAPERITKPADPIPETGAPSIDTIETRIPQRLNLVDFGVTRFEYKTEIEPHLSPVLQSAQMLQMMRSSPPIREIKPVRPASSFDTLMQNASSESELSTRPAVLTRPDEVQHVRLVFEPPPPPPVVRSVSMDIGDPDSQVRVVIRERNGNLNVQLGSTNERLREDLQVAGPMLMRELQRNNPMSVTLDFSNFGSATDADSQSRSQSRAKKILKPDAEFADVVETAYLPGPSSELKSL